MVLKSITIYLIEKYLGDYIKNFDRKKLLIDLWDGNIYLFVNYIFRKYLFKRRCIGKILLITNNLY